MDMCDTHTPKQATSPLSPRSARRHMDMYDMHSPIQATQAGSCHQPRYATWGSWASAKCNPNSVYHELSHARNEARDTQKGTVITQAQGLYRVTGI